MTDLSKYDKEENKIINCSMGVRDFRFNKVYHLATQAQDNWMSDDLFDEFVMDAQQLWQAMDIGPVTAINMLEPERHDQDEFQEELYSILFEGNNHGFLCQLIAPIPQFAEDSDGNGYHMSYGYATTHWVYGESMDDCAKKAGAWTEAYILRKRNEQLEKFEASE